MLILKFFMALPALYEVFVKSSGQIEFVKEVFQKYHEVKDEKAKDLLRRDIAKLFR